MELLCFGEGCDAMEFIVLPRRQQQRQRGAAALLAALSLIILGVFNFLGRYYATTYLI
jgi:hypothetical protein